MVAFSISHVSKTYGNVHAVGDVSLELKSGRIMAVVGPNGAGKSTLLKMACGLVAPDSGEVALDGVPIGKLKSRLYRQLSAVLEDSSLAYMTLKGWLNLDYQGALYGLSREETRRRADPMLERLGLKRYMDGRVGDWSRGTQQKLALVTALLIRPKVLLLDESTLGLDVVSKRDFLKEVRRLANKGTAILMTSHQSEVIENFADDVMLLESGRSLWRSTLAEFMEQFAPEDEQKADLEQVLLGLFDGAQGVYDGAAGNTGIASQPSDRGGEAL